MATGGRYQARGAEAEFEPGSRKRVLRNLLGIHSVRAMARAESEALLDATNHAIDATRADLRFTAADICRLHRVWLGHIYPWAGQCRQVNIGKGGFMFAAAHLVPREMELLERGPLRDLTPCRFGDVDAQALAIGTVHAELIRIHPFREGNGRCARLLATLMGLPTRPSGPSRPSHTSQGSMLIVLVAVLLQPVQLPVSWSVSLTYSGGAYVKLNCPAASVVPLSVPPLAMAMLTAIPALGTPFSVTVAI